MEDGRTDIEAEALIAELATHSAELSAMLHETASTLAKLLAARPRADGDGADGAGSPALARDVLEIATLQAHAAGISLEDYLRDAVLAYAARPEALDGDGDGHGHGDRRARIRDEARRLRAESEAVKAQTGQATTHAKHLKAQSQARRGRATG
jgi:hypothetical protein